jgi:hypothetical protein
VVTNDQGRIDRRNALARRLLPWVRDKSGNRSAYRRPSSAGIRWDHGARAAVLGARARRRCRSCWGYMLCRRPPARASPYEDVRRRLKSTAICKNSGPGTQMKESPRCQGLCRRDERGGVMGGVGSACMGNAPARRGFLRGCSLRQLASVSYCARPGGCPGPRRGGTTRGSRVASQGSRTIGRP